MEFFNHEVERLTKLFPHEKATLEDDLAGSSLILFKHLVLKQISDFELDVIKSFGSLKYHAHYYLDTRIRFLPSKSDDPSKPKPREAYITCYIADGSTVEKIIDDITDAMNPNYKIFIGKLIILLI